MATPLGCCIQFCPYAGKNSILQEYENIGIGLCASVVVNLVSKPPVMQTSNYYIIGSWCISSCKLSRKTSCDADLQLLNCHGQLFYKPSFAEALERKASCYNKNDESKPNS